MRIPIAAAAAVAGLMLGSGHASAGFCADPASNFSAYDYQGPHCVRG